ncbi:MAG: hypothetical protein ABJM29_10635 [Rhizobiaceae bacterium]
MKREHILRVAEVLTLLGFVHTPRYFAEFHMGLPPRFVEWFVKGNLKMIQPVVVKHLRDKLNAVHAVLAREISDAEDVWQLWVAQSRYNLLQTALELLD